MLAEDLCHRFVRHDEDNDDDETIGRIEGA